MTTTTEERITFIITADASGKPSAVITEESQELLRARQKETSNDVVTAAIDIILNTIAKGTDEIMKLVPPSMITKYHNVKVNAITIPISYVAYLADERKNYGDPGFRAEIVAASQTAGGVIFALAGGVAGSAGGSAAALGIGTVAGGLGGTITAAVTYDVVDIAGQPTKDWIGDAVRSLYPLTSPKKDQYIVQIGDTLSGIAQKYNTDVPSLLKENKGITNRDSIKPEDTVILPGKPAGKATSDNSDRDVDPDLSAEFVGSATVAMAGGLGGAAASRSAPGSGNHDGRRSEKYAGSSESKGAKGNKRSQGSNDNKGGKGSSGGDGGEAGSTASNSGDNLKESNGESGDSKILIYLCKRGVRCIGS